MSGENDIAHVTAIERHIGEVAAAFSGQMNTDATSGDFSFTLYPL